MFSMLRHPRGRPRGQDRVYTAFEERCPDCGRVLPIYQVDSRLVEGLDVACWMRRRDKRCRRDCPGARPIFYAPRDLRLVLPRRIYGLDVTLHVGERHLLDGVALARITRDLKERGVPIDQRHTGRVFRDFLALTMLQRGDEAALQTRLRSQGGMVLMCDGVQFEDRSPVLYIVWDAISGEPLFGERKPYRGEDDLVPLLKRVRAMDVPVIGIVTDKEKGLVPAVQQVFPGVPYQYCQHHFLKNCAKPLQTDLTALQASVRRRADEVREIGKRLASAATTMLAPTGDAEGTIVQSAEDAGKNVRSGELPAASASPPEPSSTSPPLPASLTAPTLPPVPSSTASSTVLTEQSLVRELSELVRVNSRVSGKAPLDPPELKRHQRLEELRSFVKDARKKRQPRRPRAPLGLSSTS